MIKVVSLIMAAVMLMFICCGCSEFEEAYKQGVEKAEQAIADKERNDAAEPFFERIQRQGATEIWREKRTDVLYLIRFTNSTSGSGIGMTVMLHPDGSPLLYAEWVTMEGAQDG